MPRLCRIRRACRPRTPSPCDLAVRSRSNPRSRPTRRSARPRSARSRSASSEGLCAGLRLRGALSVAHGAGESVSRCPAGKNVALRPTRRQAGFDEFQATETVSWSRGGHSGLCSVISHGNNVLWKHTMASPCGETRLVVILRTNGHGRAHRPPRTMKMDCAASRRGPTMRASDGHVVLERHVQGEVATGPQTGAARRATLPQIVPCAVSGEDASSGCG